MQKIKVGLCQLFVTSAKQCNLKKARELVLQASKNGCELVVLPECFNSPYGTQFFPQYAESLQGETRNALSDMAKEANVHLIGGSFPEKLNDKFYNTCTIFDNKGLLLGIHRKIHLFDINIKGKQTFKESEILSPGNEVTMVKTKFGPIGIGICYDLRFPELAMIAARKGCIAMIYPGAFNTTTGPLHWELLLRSRAVDNQFYVAACSPARDLSATYHAYGHSIIIDPMGKILSECGENEDIVYGEIDLQFLKDTRESIPVSIQRRFDIYKDVSEGF